MKKVFFAIFFFLFIGAKSVFAVEDPTVFNLRVMFVELNPVENGQDMIKYFYGSQFSGKTTDQALDLGINANIDAFKRISNNKINYQIVKRVEITTFPKYTNGYVYDFTKYSKCTVGATSGPCETQKYYFDYIDWAKSNNICQLAKDNNIDEIWMASAPFITIWENFMIGPKDGFNVNGSAYVVPECIKNYVVMSSGWEDKSFTHIYGHRVEATMRYIINNWKTEDKNKYWENFAALGLYSQPYGTVATPIPRNPYCGNAHFAHNSIAHYDVGNTSYKDSTCKDWKNIPNFIGYKESVNCSSWHCYDYEYAGWGEYWMGSLPREQGELILTSNTGVKFMMKNNWWYYLLYPKNAIALMTSEWTATPIPTSAPTASPVTPTNIPTIIPTVAPTVIPTITPTPAPFPGDSNGDGLVNEIDYQVWINHFPGTTTLGAVAGDFDNNGVVDGVDYIIWLTHYSNSKN